MVRQFTFYILCSILCLSSTGAHSQSTHSIWIQAHTGLYSGWWTWNKGSTDPDVYNNLGWGNTHVHPMIPVGITLFYQNKRGRIGPVFQYRSFIDDLMRGSNNASFQAERITIADKFVSFLSGGIALEYDLAQRGRYTLSPGVLIGFSRIYSLHPEQDNFGVQWLWEAKLDNQISVSDRMRICVGLVYSNTTMYLKENSNYHEKHKVYGMGLQGAIKWALWSSKN